MPGREWSDPLTQQVVFCLVPRELAPQLHEPLRRHFLADTRIEVVVERRGAERRGRDRRHSGAPGEPAADRRTIRNQSGRRVGDRRALLVSLETFDLPRRARRYADRIVFVERLEPARQELEELDTARVVTRIQAGDLNAFELLYTRYFDRVYAYLRMALNDSHDAEDLAQEVFVRALQAIPRYERRTSPFSAWLFTIVRNCLRTRLERRHRIELVDPAEMEREETIDVSAEVAVLGWISDRDLLTFIERLPLAQRQVLLLRNMFDLSYADTAAVLGLTQENVRKLQWRALQFLRARLAAVGRVPGRSRPAMVRTRTPAQVLRHRRFALLP
jgi:RNA polymerase sigma-70 factor (ECF subfamily)